LNRTRFVAEVSSNHNQNLQRCLDFVDTAAEIGCDAVKFQLFRIDQLFAPEILHRSESHRKRKEWELPIDFIGPIKRRCETLGIGFGCTPFYLGAVKTLKPFVAFLKIASYELLWEPLLACAAGSGCSVVLSTGMADIIEIDTAVRTIRNKGCEHLELLHCVSGYPVGAKDCNLKAIETLRERFRCPVGWSDHSVDPGVILRAVHRWEASSVEFHLDLEGKGAEFQTGHCWLPDDIQKVIALVRTGEESDGTGEKLPTQAEVEDRQWRTDPEDGLRPLQKVRSDWR
jgi:N-acetylneuraminate synthase